MNLSGHPFDVVRFRAPWLALWLCGMAACSQGDPPPPPANFSRPEDVAFVCFQIEGGRATPIPLAECPNPRESTDDRVLHALVTQTSTGEVAAVEMRPNRTSIGTQPGRVIDSRADIPGFTFVNVGAVPSDIVVPRFGNHPMFTYVASYGSGTISVFETTAFRPIREEQRIARVGAPLDLGVRPAEMLLDPRPDERYLYVTAPEDGLLLRIEICRGRDDCEEGTLLTPERFPLSLSDDVLSLPEAPGRSPEEPYNSDGVCKVCRDGSCTDYTYAPAPRMEPPTLAAAMAIDPQAGARPHSLAWDLSACPDASAPECEPILLVGDENLPAIHRVKASDPLEVIEPLATRVPVSDVVATPLVPVAPGSQETTHYVYAIDATDGSVLAMQDGEILTVGEVPFGRQDRIAFSLLRDGERAMSLEVVTPGYEGPDAEPRCTLTETEAANIAVIDLLPNRLRGVFLMVGATDGRIRVVDVHDLDLAGKVAGTTERGCTRDCPLFVKRHRPRFASALPDDEPVAVPADDGSGAASNTLALRTLVRVMTYRSGTQTFQVGSDGTSRNSRLPGAACLPCDELGMSDGFPTLPSAEVDTNTSSPSDEGSTGQPERDFRVVSTFTDAGMEMVEEQPQKAEAVDPTVQEAAACQEGQGRVCTLGDPWTASQDEWSFYLEGPIPGANGRRGRLVTDGDTLRWLVEEDMCEAGVLPGDQLVIRGVPDLLSRADITDPECLEYIRVMEDPTDPRVLGFAIEKAGPNELVVRDQAVERFVGLPATLTKLNTCFPPLGEGGEQVSASVAIAYEVRALNAFLAQSVRIGYVHDVQTVDGQCVDAAALMSGPRRTARVPICKAEPRDPNDEQPAFEKPVSADDPCVFNNGHIAVSMRVEKLDALPRDAPSFLLIQVLPPSDHLIFDAQDVSGYSQTGVLPFELVYSPTDLRLYMIDPQLRGLLPITLDRFPTALASIASHLN